MQYIVVGVLRFLILSQPQGAILWNGIECFSGRRMAWTALLVFKNPETKMQPLSATAIFLFFLRIAAATLLMAIVQLLLLWPFV